MHKDMKRKLLKKKSISAFLVMLMMVLAPSSSATLMVYKIKGNVTVKSKATVKKRKNGLRFLRQTS